MISFTCSGCAREFKVKDELAGKRTKCPGCGSPLRVPEESLAVTTGSAARQPPPLPEAGKAADDRTVAPDPVPSSHETIGHAGVVDRETYDFLAPPQAADEIGRLGPYRILKVLGAGGMGVVFMAEDPQLRRIVAIKAMRPALAASASAGKRFLREAQATAAIKHDHIVTIYQVSEDRDVPFLAMEFLEGQPLDDRLHRETCPPLAEVLRIGREIAQGLAAAHGKGLIHRDIKPANIWLEADSGRVKIVDFGLARAASEESQITQQGAIIGTPAYMAPEQASGQPVHSRCDLFSLGCVLYRMATGQLPYRGNDTISTIMAVATETPASPVELNPEIPTALADLIMRLLAKKPEERPESARAVADALRAMEQELTLAMTASGVRAGPPPIPARRGVLVAAIAVGLLLAAGGVAAVLRLMTGEGTRQTGSADPKTETIAEQAGDRGPGEPDDFNKRVAALPAEEQLKVVLARLKEVNPSFNVSSRNVNHKIVAGVITELDITSAFVNDLSPVRALPGLTSLACKGLSIKGNTNSLEDLKPLAGLSLHHLNITHTDVVDLRPLKGMPLQTLNCSYTKVKDLKPLIGLPLTNLNVTGCPIRDYSPLESLSLQELTFSHKKASKKLDVNLQSIKTLKTINDMPAADFWKNTGAK